MIVDVETHAVKRLTGGTTNDNSPAWSPRGGFKDEAPLHPFNPQPYGEIYVMRADGSELRVLTDDQFEQGTPTWNPARPRHGASTKR